MRSVVLAVLRALLVCLSLASAARAQSTDDAVARKLFEAGKVAYDAGEYEDALRFFEQAHDRSARPGLLYNIGQAADRLREDERALTAYRAYLQQVPGAANRAEVEGRIRAMERAQRRERPHATQADEPSAPRVVPTPEATARAATPAIDATPTSAPVDDHIEDDEGGVTSRWWFWTAIGVVVVGSVIAVAALSTSDPGQPTLVQGDVEGVVTTLQAAHE